MINHYHLELCRERGLTAPDARKPNLEPKGIPETLDLFRVGLISQGLKRMPTDCLSKLMKSTSLALPDTKQESAFTHHDAYIHFWVHMDVSENSGTPKSPILIGFSIINHPFWGTTILGNPHIVGRNLAPVDIDDPHVSS